MTQGTERHQLWMAAVRYVPGAGWTPGILEKAAQDLGMHPMRARQIFLGGLPEVAEAYEQWLDAEMARSCRERPEWAELRTTGRVKLAVRVRIGLIDKPVGSRLAGYYARPSHVGAAVKAIARTADAVWRLVGDDSVDFNYYTKRALLGGVYAATLAYWLRDDSVGSEKTWAFLDARIADVMRFSGKVKGAFQAAGARFR